MISFVSGYLLLLSGCNPNARGGCPSFKVTQAIVENYDVVRRPKAGNGDNGFYEYGAIYHMHYDGKFFATNNIQNVINAIVINSTAVYSGGRSCISPTYGLTLWLPIMASSSEVRAYCEDYGLTGATATVYIISNGEHCSFIEYGMDFIYIGMFFVSPYTSAGTLRSSREMTSSNVSDF